MAYSFVEYIHQTPSNAVYNFGFTYISREDIKVTVDGVPSTLTFNGENTIEVVPEPSLGSLVRIYRDTNKISRVVDFQDGSTVNEGQLDLSAIQLFYLIQESLDRADNSIEFINGEWQGQGYVASGFADPVDGSDLVTVDWAETSGSSFVMQSQEAAQLAQAIQSQLYGLTITVNPIAENGTVNGTYNATTGVLTLNLPEGNKGATGDVGETGSKGPQGATGIQGIQGVQGVKGVTGDKGPLGDQGTGGAVGVQGGEGVDGPMGATPLGLAFGQFNVDADGYLFIEYYGAADDNDFTIGTDGYLYVSVVGGRGLYNPAITYTAGDSVYDENGNYFMAAQSVPQGEPPTS